MRPIATVLFAIGGVNVYTLAYITIAPY